MSAVTVAGGPPRPGARAPDWPGLHRADARFDAALCGGDVALGGGAGRAARGSARCDFFKGGSRAMLEALPAARRIEVR